jgi:hypothetical protein
MIPTEREIAKGLMNWRIWVCQDLAALNNAHIIWEADVFTINKNRFVYEFEIKRSIPDMRADFRKKKVKHQLYSSNMIDGYHSPYQLSHLEKLKESKPNRFYYVLPPELAEAKLIQELVPDYAGLLTFNFDDDGVLFWRSFKRLKQAPFMHKNKVSDKILDGMLHKLSIRYNRTVDMYYTELNNYNEARKD